MLCRPPARKVPRPAVSAFSLSFPPLSLLAGVVADTLEPPGAAGNGLAAVTLLLPRRDSPFPQNQRGRSPLALDSDAVWAEEACTRFLTPRPPSSTYTEDSIQVHHLRKLVIASPVVLTGPGRGSYTGAKLGGVQGKNTPAAKTAGSMGCPTPPLLTRTLGPLAGQIPGFKALAPWKLPKPAAMPGSCPPRPYSDIS